MQPVDHGAALWEPESAQKETTDERVTFSAIPASAVSRTRQACRFTRSHILWKAPVRGPAAPEGPGPTRAGLPCTSTPGPAVGPKWAEPALGWGPPSLGCRPPALRFTLNSKPGGCWTWWRWRRPTFTSLLLSAVTGTSWTGIRSLRTPSPPASSLSPHASLLLFGKSLHLSEPSSWIDLLSSVCVVVIEVQFVEVVQKGN